MCIRDRLEGLRIPRERWDQKIGLLSGGEKKLVALARLLVCLLYTSDAADERSSVDLGGRRIIKKKNDIRTKRRPTNDI